MDVLCGGCGRTLTLDDGEAVHDVPCPHCGRLIQVSAMDGDGPGDDDDRMLAPLDASDDLDDDFLAKARLALRKKLLVVCRSCQEKLTVNQKLAGMTARCPSCGKKIVVPSMNEEGEGLQRRPQPHDLGVEPAVPAEAIPAGEASSLRQSRLRRAARAKKKPNMVGVMFLMCLITAVGGAVLGYLLFRGGNDGSTPGNPKPPPARGGPSRQDPWATMPKTTKPATPGPLDPWPNAGGQDPTPAPIPRAPLTPTLLVMAATLDILTGDGLIPAPAGKAFVVATVRIRAGEEPVRFDAAGTGVRLVFGGGDTPSLGVPAAKDAFAVGPRQAAVDIPPMSSHMLTLAFLAPTTLQKGARILIDGVAEAPLPPLPKLRTPDRKRLSGSYAEAARFLKLGFADPAMERIRTSGKHDMVITGRKDHLEVAIGKTGLTGQATREPDGSYKADLTDGSAKLAGRLRVLGDGKHVVLYLSDDPYHQVVYRKQ